MNWSKIKWSINTITKLLILFHGKKTSQQKWKLQKTPKIAKIEIAKIRLAVDNVVPEIIILNSCSRIECKKHKNATCFLSYEGIQKLLMSNKCDSHTAYNEQA